MSSYLLGVWRARHFWTHLALSDLRSRWRRSFFGLLWSVIQPLGMTVLLALVFSRLFNADIHTYLPFILSGMIVWDCAMSCVAGGALSFVQADAYIKQTKHPLAIYTLRTVLASLAILVFASSALFVWAGIALPHNIGWHWVAALSIVPVLGIILWPLATLLAYCGARFRDIPHATGLAMQALWFISPVYFEPKMFRQGGLDVLVDLNPVFHILQIVRAPLLEGRWPDPANYVFALATSIALTALAYAVGRVAERKVIFYL